mgnify:CR=1 FL=1
MKSLVNANVWNICNIKASIEEWQIKNSISGVVKIVIEGITIIIDDSAIETHISSFKAINMHKIGLIPLFYIFKVLNLSAILSYKRSDKFKQIWIFDF